MLATNIKISVAKKLLASLGGNILAFLLINFQLISGEVAAQPSCATVQHLVKTDFFDFGPAGNGTIAINGLSQFGWIGGGTAGSIIDANATLTYFSANGATQTMTQSVTNVNLKGNGAIIVISIAASDVNPRTSSNGASFTIAYNGLVYCTITNPTTPDADPENATVNYGNTATGPAGITSTTIPVTAAGTTSFSTITIILPPGIANNGNLLLTFNASGAQNDDFTVQSVSMLSCPVNFTGNIYDDANGSVNNIVDGPAYTSPTSLYVYLVNGSGNVAAKSIVDGSGTFTDTSSTPGAYTLRLSTVTTTNIGSPAPAAGVPAGWINTGEHLGVAGVTGNDGTADGNLNPLAIANSITNTDQNAQFGLERLPIATNKTFDLTSPTAGNSILNLKGNSASGVSAGTLTGSDAEDGSYQVGSNVPYGIQLTQTPTNGTLLYNGLAMTLNQTLNPYDTSKLQFQFTGTGYNTTNFKYTVIDAAGKPSTPATYTVNLLNTLPVRLTGFTVTKSKDHAVLKWITQMEENSSRFEIERGRDDSSFIKLGAVAAAGNSGSALYYQYPDNNVIPGNLYYRLKMIDLDGQYSYSPVAKISFTETELDASPSFLLYPNPVKKGGLLAVTGKNIRSVLIFDIAGKRVWSGRFENPSTVQIPIIELPRGIYTVRVNSEAQQFIVF